MRIEIDADRCTACDVCVDLCPEVFKIVDNLAVAICPEKCTEDDCCRSAADACPTGAITIYKDE